eukprot:c18290_g1_i1 orf=249-647(+)
MASVSAAFPASSFLHLHPLSPSSPPSLTKPGLGLPALPRHRMACAAHELQEEHNLVSKVTTPSIVAAALAVTHPAIALVDERLSTEGTGLSLGLSNSALGWILLGVATFIWSFYFVYTSTLPEGDDDSGLAL